MSFLNKPLHWLLRKMEKVFDGTDAITGINFGGSTLNAYSERQTWTPTVIGATSGEASYTVQSGLYTRIGDMVMASFRMDFTKNTISGTVRIGGLPVTPDLGAVRCGVAWALVDEITFTDMLAADAIDNTGYLTLRNIISGGNVANLADTALHASNTMILAGSIFYHV